jgi:hypothetical protein
VERDPVQPNWRLRRLLYNVALLLYLATVFYLAHNRILFGQWMPYTTADLAPMVNQQLAPIVRAMKEYQTVYGSPPMWTTDLVPWFPDRGPHQPNRQLWRVSIHNGAFYYRHNYGQITYNFPPGPEGWEIHGSILNGKIPAPIVATPPMTRP